MNTSVNVQLAGGTTGTDDQVSLRLEQEVRPVDAVTINDIYAMWVYAKSGLSARTYKPYDSDVSFNNDTITFSIGFYVWPDPFDLPYELSASIAGDENEDGESLTQELEDISEAEVAEVGKQQSVIFPLSSRVEFDAVVESIEYEWETPVFNRFGVTIPAPEITLVSNALTIPGDYFGSARVNFIQKGYYHTLSVTLPNVNEEGQNIQIDDINIIITATWEDLTGELQTTTLNIELPDALKAALKLCGGNHSMICYDCDNYEARVYYSTCDGSVVDVRIIDLDGSGSWCIPVS